MAKIQRRNGETRLHQRFIAVLAAGQIAIVPGPAMEIDHDRKRPGAGGTKQPQLKRLAAMNHIVDVFGGKVLRYSRHRNLPLKLSNWRFGSSVCYLTFSPC